MGALEVPAWYRKFFEMLQRSRAMMLHKVVKLYNNKVKTGIINTPLNFLLIVDAL